jgi:hypothetical protein
MLGRQASFWLAVAGVAAMTPVGMNLLTDHLGDKLPALKKYQDYATRRNG